MHAAMDTGDEDDGVIEIRPLPFVDIGGYRAHEGRCKAEMETFNSKIAAATDEHLADSETSRGRRDLLIKKRRNIDAAMDTSEGNEEDEDAMTGIITFQQQQAQQQQQQPHH
ncbi:hypothetical protein DFQ26_005708 [Actinomortierella ambigua]|nr:hypothetical protein DFQ26_005708 [Actinomortierella ambigua]